MDINRETLTSALLLLSLSLTGCVSYEPAILAPALTLSPEDVVLADASGDSSPYIDFGLEVGVNESDSLFNVETLPGVRVRDIVANGAAATAGIQVGDVILAVDGMEINHPDALSVLSVLSVQQEQEQGTGAGTEFRFNVRRNTTVFEATVSGRPVAGNAPSRELYRVDPLATRAGYETELLNLRGQGDVAAARVVRLFPGSTLPAARIEPGDRVLALNGRNLNSAQDLITRLNRDHALGDRVQFTVYDGDTVSERSVQLWDPGRRISRITLGPLLRYESSLSPSGSRLSILDFWLFAVYSYNRVEGEESHSFLGLFNFTSDYGELVEEQD